MKLIKKLEKDLLNELSEQVGRYGFDKKVKGQSFYKKMPFGRVVLHLSFIEHDDLDFDVTADVAIRFNELEDIINEYNVLLSKAEKSNTFSLGAELGNISEGRPKRWTITSPTDVEKVSQAITDAFSKIGVPYLEKYSNMETALEALSGDDQTAWLHQPLHGARALRALGLAFLLNKPEKFSNIADVKTAFLVVKDPLGLQPFLQLRDALEHRFITSLEGQ